MQGKLTLPYKTRCFLTCCSIGSSDIVALETQGNTVTSITIKSPLETISMGRRLVFVLMACFVVVGISSGPEVKAQTDSLQVLHWWDSASEHKAIDLIASKLKDENIGWQDAVIPAGSGVGEIIVLKSRVIAGSAPDVAQLNGPVIGEWAKLGLLLDLDAVASSGKWEKSLQPGIYNWIRPQGHVVAVPLGIHRVNTLFFNPKIFAQHQLNAPRNWDEFEQVAAKLKQAGIAPLAQSSEPWQVATLFETIVLGDAGPEFYRKLFVRKDPGAYADPRFADALQRLRRLKQWMLPTSGIQTWPEMTRKFIDGDAAMLIMGDWAKGEMNAWGFATEKAFACVAAPGTANFHLYDIDTIAMFPTIAAHSAAQQKLAQLVVSTAVQTEYNQIKGSIPALRNPDVSKFDSCARNSFYVFSRGATAPVPSFAHRMATDETSRDAIVGEVHRFFADDQLTVKDTQRKLVSMSRILEKIGLENDTQNPRR